MNSAPDHSLPPQHATDLPSLDPERMEMLRELCLDAGQDILKEMLTSWETEAARHLSNVSQAMTAANVEAIKVAAHALKGSCGNMGIVRLAELGRQLEHQAGTPAEAAVLIGEMQTEFDRARDALAKITG